MSLTFSSSFNLLERSHMESLYSLSMIIGWIGFLWSLWCACCSVWLLIFPEKVQLSLLSHSGLLRWWFGMVACSFVALEVLVSLTGLWSEWVVHSSAVQWKAKSSWTSGWWFKRSSLLRSVVFCVCSVVGGRC